MAKERPEREPRGRREKPDPVRSESKPCEKETGRNRRRDPSDRNDRKESGLTNNDTVKNTFPVTADKGGKEKRERPNRERPR
jgi:hypothetical protein